MEGTSANAKKNSGALGLGVPNIRADTDMGK